MQLPEKRFITFLRKHHVFALGTCRDGTPHTASCFYAFDGENISLIFTSDQHTKHATDMLLNNRVSANIHLETKLVGKIRGIQITGNVRLASGTEESHCRNLYLRRFPYAVIMKTCFWILEIESMKMTDNRLGFGKKLHWHRNDS